MIEPIALENREPQLSDLDEHNCCWWWDETLQCYEKFCGDMEGIANIREYNKRYDYPHNHTHWLPYWAIKQPQEKENEI